MRSKRSSFIATSVTGVSRLEKSGDLFACKMRSQRLHYSSMLTLWKENATGRPRSSTFPPICVMPGVFEKARRHRPRYPAIKLNFRPVLMLASSVLPLHRTSKKSALSTIEQLSLQALIKTSLLSGSFPAARSVLRFQRCYPLISTNCRELILVLQWTTRPAGQQTAMQHFGMR